MRTDDLQQDEDGCSCSKESLSSESARSRRYTWMNASGRIVSRNLTDYECQLEDDVQKLQDALFSISSHYAKIQFRLRQIASASGHERICLLRELERVTCRGIDDTQLHSSELPTLLCDTQRLGDVRVKQQKIIAELRCRLGDLADIGDIDYDDEPEQSYEEEELEEQTHGKHCACVVCQEGKECKGPAYGNGYLSETWPSRGDDILPSGHTAKKKESKAKKKKCSDRVECKKRSPKESQKIQKSISDKNNIRDNANYGLRRSNPSSNSRAGPKQDRRSPRNSRFVKLVNKIEPGGKVNLNLTSKRNSKDIAPAEPRKRAKSTQVSHQGSFIRETPNNVTAQQSSRKSYKSTHSQVEQKKAQEEDSMETPSHSLVPGSDVVQGPDLNNENQFNQREDGFQEPQRINPRTYGSQSVQQINTHGSILKCPGSPNKSSLRGTNSEHSTKRVQYQCGYSSETRRRKPPGVEDNDKQTTSQVPNVRRSCAKVAHFYNGFPCGQQCVAECSRTRTCPYQQSMKNKKLNPVKPSCSNLNGNNKSKAQEKDDKRNLSPLGSVLTYPNHYVENAKDTHLLYPNVPGKCGAPNNSKLSRRFYRAFWPKFCKGCQDQNIIKNPPKKPELNCDLQVSQSQELPSTPKEAKNEEA